MGVCLIAGKTNSMAEGTTELCRLVPHALVKACLPACMSFKDRDDVPTGSEHAHSLFV